MAFQSAQTMQVTIPGPGPWGFRLAGGKDFNTPLHISKITPGGKAARANLVPKDTVSSINGTDTSVLTHLEAQNKIKNAVGDLNLNIQRGEATIWKPKVTDDYSSGQQGVNVSLAADKQQFTHAGSSHNVAAKPFPGSGAPPGAGLGTATVVHKQFNSPVGIYSSENIAETFKGQTEGMITGALGGSSDAGGFPAADAGGGGGGGGGGGPGYDAGSPVYRAVQHEQSGGGYDAYQNTGAQSRSFKMLQQMTAEDDADYGSPPSSTPPTPAQQAYSQPAQPQQAQPQQPRVAGTRSVKPPQSRPGAGGQKPESTLPMCEGCNRAIVGPFVKVRNRSLHPDCFKCLTCGCSLRNQGYFWVEGGMYCEKDAKAKATPPPGANVVLSSNTSGGGVPNGTSRPAPVQQAPRGGPPPGQAQRAHPGQQRGPPRGQPVPVSLQSSGEPVKQFRPPPTPPPKPQPRFPAKPKEDPNIIIAMALAKNPDATKDIMGVVPIFIADNIVKHEIIPHGQVQLPSTMSWTDGQDDIDPRSGVKQSPSQVAQQSRAPQQSPQRTTGGPPQQAGPAAYHPPAAQAPVSRGPSGPPPGPGSQGPTKMVDSGTRTPVCEGCNSIIRGPFVSAIGRNWHPEHFVCAHCHENLKNKTFVEEKGKIYCEEDFVKLYADKCHKCGKNIGGPGVSALGGKFHPECFLCEHCHEPISGGKFRLSDGKPYCEKDYRALHSTMCSGCEFIIDPGDPWLEALDKAWHANCFVCSICQSPLEGQSFYAKMGRPFCQAHAN